MKAIWKYQLASEEHQIVELPIGYKILTIQNQNGSPVLWALIDPAQRSTDIVGIRSVMTGELLRDDDPYTTYISTAQFGAIVVHFFKR